MKLKTTMGKVTMRMITAKPGPFRIGSIMQGYQRILTRHESFSIHNASDQQREGVRNPGGRTGLSTWSSSARSRCDGYVHLRPAHDGRCTSIVPAPSAGLAINSRTQTRTISCSTWTLRPRLLSGAAQSVRLHVLLAVVNILVDARGLSAWSSGCKRQCTPLVDGRVCAEWQNTLSPQLSAGGRSTMASLLPTKTLAIGGDTGTDHPSVPACVK